MVNSPLELFVPTAILQCIASSPAGRLGISDPRRRRRASIRLWDFGGVSGAVGDSLECPQSLLISNVCFGWKADIKRRVDCTILAPTRFHKLTAAQDKPHEEANPRYTRSVG